jgi:hypothetical protein
VPQKRGRPASPFPYRLPCRRPHRSSWRRVDRVAQRSRFPRDNQWFASGRSQAADGVHRNALHQALGIDVRVEECSRERLQRSDHFQRSDCCEFAPAPDRHTALSGIDVSNTSAPATCQPAGINRQRVRLARSLGMVGAIGFEFWGRRSFNNIEARRAPLKQWKAVVSSANGSQMDHGSCPSEKCQPRRPQNLRLSIETGPIGMACVGDRVSTSAWQQF